MAMDLGEELGLRSVEIDRFKRDHTPSGDVLTRIALGETVFYLTSSQVQVQKINYNGSCLLGNPSNGILGTSTLGARGLTTTSLYTDSTKYGILTMGATEILEWLGTSASNYPCSVAFGNSAGTIGITNTSCFNETFKQGSSSHYVTISTSNKYIQWTVEILPNQNTTGVNEMCMTNTTASSSGDAFIYRTFSSQTASVTHGLRFIFDLTGSFNIPLQTHGMQELFDWLSGGTNINRPYFYGWGSSSTLITDTSHTSMPSKSDNFTISSRTIYSATNSPNSYSVALRSTMGVTDATGNNLRTIGLESATSGGKLWYYQNIPHISKSDRFNIYAETFIKIRGW